MSQRMEQYKPKARLAVVKGEGLYSGKEDVLDLAVKS